MVSEFNYIHQRDLRDGGKLATASESDLQRALNGWLQQRLIPYQKEGFRQTLHTDTQRTTTTTTTTTTVPADGKGGETTSCTTSLFSIPQERTNHSIQVVPLGRTSRQRVPKQYRTDDCHFIPQSHFLSPLSLTFQNDTRTTNVTEPADHPNGCIDKEGCHVRVEFDLQYTKHFSKAEMFTLTRMW